MEELLPFFSSLVISWSKQPTFKLPVPLCHRSSNHPFHITCEITLFTSPTSHPIGYHLISSVSDFPFLIPYVNKLKPFKGTLT